MDAYLETERLILRRFTADDVDNLTALDSDPEVMRYTTGGKPTPRDVVEREVIPRFIDEYRRYGNFGHWAAIEKESGAFLGWFGLCPHEDSPPGEVELGYRLRRPAWGKGYATEGARALVNRAFAELGVQRIVATADRVNYASRRVMEKAGLSLVRIFRFEDPWPHLPPGPEQDGVDYALSREDWERQTQ
jgi:RimJ/RimL family protein N-acetyltransferase